MMNDSGQLSDYNPDSVRLIQFGEFSMYSTQRLSGVYVPGTFEQFTSDLIRFSLKPGMTMVDIGAHHGYYSLLASAVVGPEGRVIACEPVAENRELMQRSIRHNGYTNITGHQVAVSDVTGRAVFCIAGASDACSFYENPNSPTLQRRELETTTIDDLLGNQPADIIKIDTEGHEPRILKGMRGVLAANPAVRLFIEFNPRCLASAGFEPGAFLAELDQYGFDIYFIADQERLLYRFNTAIPGGWKQVMADRSYANLLCIKRGQSCFVNILSHSSGVDGGAEKLLTDIVSWLLSERFLVHVTLPGDGPMKKYLENRPVSLDLHPLPYWVRRSAADLPQYLERIAPGFGSLVSSVSIRNPHLVVTNTSVIPQGALVAKILGIPHVWRINEFGLAEYGIDYLVGERDRKEFIAGASCKVIFVSNALRETYESFLATDQGVTMHSAVNDLMEISRVPAYHRNPVTRIICPATILEGKRQEDLIRAIHLLDLKGVSSVQVTFMGGSFSKTYLAKLTGLIREYGLESRVVFRPFSGNLWVEYSDAEIVVSTSVNEGFGRIVAEGMVHGKLVIGSDSGATRELISHGETGLLFQPGNPDDLAEKILDYINETVDTGKIRQTAFEFINRLCHPGRYQENFALLLREACEKTTRGPQDAAMRSNGFYRSFLEQWTREFLTVSDEREAMVKDLEAVNRSVQALNRDLFSKKNDLDSMRSSLSWRITGPFRSLFKGLYNLRQKLRRKRVVIYTIIFGYYDDLKEPEWVHPEFDYICFTDRDDLVSRCWQIRKVSGRGHGNLKRRAGELIIYPFDLLGRYEISILVGGQVSIHCNVVEFLKMNLPEGCGMAVSPHPLRDCFYEEAEAVLKYNKESRQVIQQQVEKYRNEGMPEHAGLIETGVMIRRHDQENVLLHCRLWLEEYRQQSQRDQLSFPYILWKHRLVEPYFFSDSFRNLGFRVNPHNFVQAF